MFCPNCGAPEQSPDTYCKKCGTYLRDVSFRGWLLGGNNPGKAAWAIVSSSVFVAVVCLCISFLIIRAESSGDLTYLKYAFALCWLVIGYLVILSLVGFRLWRKMRRAQSSLNETALTNNSRSVAPSPGQHTERLHGAENSGEAATELLSSPRREFEERKQAR
jgi:fumarate reductase subunit D